MKTLEQIIKEHGIYEYDVRLNAACQEYAQQFKPKWIDVNDRLPEYETPVLVYTADDYIQNAYIVVNTDRLWKGIGQWKHPKVTHWQPLPSCPA